jgi:hypothetical protein
MDGLIVECQPYAAHGNRILTTDNPRKVPRLETSVRVPENVLMRQVGEELVLLHLEAENYYGLNPVGARLMQLAETGATLQSIVDCMLAEFEVTRQQLEVDVQSLATELLAAGLLEAPAREATS